MCGRHDGQLLEGEFRGSAGEELVGRGAPAVEKSVLAGEEPETEVPIHGQSGEAIGSR